MYHNPKNNGALFWHNLLDSHLNVLVPLMIDTFFQMLYLPMYLILFSIHFNAAISYHNEKIIIYIMPYPLLLLVFLFIIFFKCLVFLFKSKKKLVIKFIKYYNLKIKYN